MAQLQLVDPNQLNVLVDAAQGLLVNQCQQQATTAAVISNATPEHMTFHENQEWSGVIKHPYPDRISKTRIGKFVHAARCINQPDEAAVVYKSGDDASASAWLVAWSVKNPAFGDNKVYAEAGPLSNFMNIDWDYIKNKLYQSNDSKQFVDNETGCKVFAQIKSAEKGGFTLTVNCMKN